MRKTDGVYLGFRYVLRKFLNKLVKALVAPEQMPRVFWEDYTKLVFQKDSCGLLCSDQMLYSTIIVYTNCIFRLFSFCINLKNNVLASRSKVRGFKPGRCQWIFFSEHRNAEHKSSGRDFKPWVPSQRYQARQRTSSLKK